MKLQNINKHRFEKGIPLAQSEIWSKLKQNYISSDVSQWEKIPHYITSNPFTSAMTVQLIIDMVNTVLERDNKAHQSPFYIVEAGAGTGEHAFHFLNHLNKNRHKLINDTVKIIYIMTDVSKSGMHEWQNSNYFKPWLVDGSLKIGYFDIAHDEAINCLDGTSIKLKACSNPIALIANYVFDSLPTDHYAVKDKTLYQTTVTSYGPKQNSPRMKNYTFQLDLHKVTQQDCYEEPYQPLFNAIYESNTQSKFNFSTVLIDTLQHLESITNGNMVIFASDEFITSGDGNPKASYTQTKDYIASFLDRNMLEKTMAAQHGRALFHMGERTTFGTAILMMSNTTHIMAGLTRSLHNAQQLKSGQYFQLLTEMERQSFRKLYHPETILMLLDISHHDPIIFSILLYDIIHYCEHGDEKTVAMFHKHLEQVVNNFYILSYDNKRYFHLGIALSLLGRYQEATHSFSKVHGTHRFGFIYNNFLYRAMLRSGKLHQASFILPIYLGATVVNTVVKFKKHLFRSIEAIFNLPNFIFVGTIFALLKVIM